MYKIVPLPIRQNGATSKYLDILHAAAELTNGDAIEVEANTFEGVQTKFLRTRLNYQARKHNILAKASFRSGKLYVYPLRSVSLPHGAAK